MSDTLITTPEEAALERRAMFRWTGIIVGLLGIHMTLCLLAVYATSGDDSLAIEPSYHQRALDWDASRQALVNSEALGWKANFNIDKTPDAFGRRAIEITLTDDQGEPITGATATAVVFHHAHAANAADVSLVEAGEGTGVYMTTHTMPPAGLWELRLKVERGDDMFLATEIHKLH